MIIKFHNLRKLHSGSFGKHRCLWTFPLFSPFGEFAEILEIKNAQVPETISKPTYPATNAVLTANKQVAHFLLLFRKEVTVQTD